MVTALGTRLGLLARKTDDPEMIASLHAQRELVQRIQESIREVLHALRPPVLDRFGLEAALREGPIERLLRDAGIGYLPQFSGPIDRIGPDVGSAVYRICQEAATNCVRHAQARQFRMQLDAAPAWGGGLEVHLRIEDDGIGMDAAAADRGNGLRGIRDRVLALAGDYRCDSDASGTRHLIWFIDRLPVVKNS
jgi:signal transduction histidine kinase